MHRVDTDGNVANLFTDGVPGVQVATQVDQHWLNAIQEEIAHFIATDAGITLVKDTNTQLGAALTKLFLKPGAAPSYGRDLTAFNGLLISARDADREAGSGRQRVYFKKGLASSSEIWITINAAWVEGSARWEKDLAAPAFALLISPVYGIRLFAEPTAAAAFDDTAWTHPQTIFTSGLTVNWVNSGGGTTPFGYSKDPAGTVRLEGNLSASGTFPSTLANLPPGFRKNCIQRFPASYVDPGPGGFLFCTIQIAANGAITTDAAAGGQVRLDGITFIADS